MKKEYLGKHTMKCTEEAFVPIPRHPVRRIRRVNCDCGCERTCEIFRILDDWLSCTKLPNCRNLRVSIRFEPRIVKTRIVLNANSQGVHSRSTIQDHCHRDTSTGQKHGPQVCNVLLGFNFVLLSFVKKKPVLLAIVGMFERIAFGRLRDFF